MSSFRDIKLLSFQKQYLLITRNFVRIIEMNSTISYDIMPQFSPLEFMKFYTILKCLFMKFVLFVKIICLRRFIVWPFCPFWTLRPSVVSCMLAESSQPFRGLEGSGPLIFDKG